MTAIRVLIVDDEAPARSKVRRLLTGEPDIAVIGEAESGTDAVDAIGRLEPDLVFLDVQMPGLDGFGVIESVGVESMPRVVFTTAYDEYAVRAFDVHALDYLLKPFTPERFALVVSRARQALAARASASGDPDEADAEATFAARLERIAEQFARRLDDGAASDRREEPEDAAVGRDDEPLPAAGRARRPLTRLLVHHQDRAFFLPADRIDRVEADRNYVRLIAGDATFTLRATIGALEERLDPSRFLRINRSQIVRMDAVKELQPWFHGDYRVVMRDGTTLMWSRRYRARDAHVFEVGIGHGPST